jgi:GTP cyclohydrolase I
MSATSKPLKDTQSEPDHRRIAIDRVGVKGLRYPFRIRDKARESQHTDRDLCTHRGFAAPFQGHSHEPLRRGAQ